MTDKPPAVRRIMIFGGRASDMDWHVASRHAVNPPLP